MLYKGDKGVNDGACSPKGEPSRNRGPYGLKSAFVGQCSLAHRMILFWVENFRSTGTLIKRIQPGRIIGCYLSNRGRNTAVI